ncbi:MAG: hypothetical protein JWQ19_3497 [Subtercola sp.]|nr:hypothetical protein [Subtercola sp.]
MSRHARFSLGTLAIAVVSVAVAVFSPLAALVLYLVVAAAFLLARLRERPALVEPDSDDG